MKEINYRHVQRGNRCELCVGYENRICKTLKGTRVKIGDMILVRLGRVEPKGLCDLFTKSPTK